MFWSHPRLDQATYANLSRFLGRTSMTSLQHLMSMGVVGNAQNKRWRDSSDHRELGTPQRCSHLLLLWVRECYL